jgi:hypothetical protein
VVTLLLDLRSRDIHLWADGDKLRFDAPAGAMDAALRDELRARKPEIIRLLREADTAEHTTHYVGVRDGVELAADVFRPKRDGAVVAEPLPVVWCHDRYHRSDVAGGILTTKLDTQPWLREVLKHGYVIAVVDARGTGASTGARTTEFGEDEAHDGYDVTEWFARQDWCNGRVGMYGDSYLAITQLLTAGTAPPHLHAIFPEMALLDLYSFLYPGGVLRDDFARNWSRMVRELDTEVEAAPVAGRAGTAADVLRGRSGVDVVGRARALPYRDSEDPGSGERPYRALSPSRAIERISASGVPICHLAGWYDLWVRDAVVWFANLENPQRLIIGGWSHNSRAGIDLAAEHLRWYDYWLKGIDNGVMGEPPIRYFTMSAPAGTEWRSASAWPPPEARPTAFYFHDGSMDPEAPVGDEAADAYTADYSTTSGRETRWVNGYGGGFRYALSANDRKALTYSTGPLGADLEVTGHPVVHLYVSCSHPDVDVFVYLEEVDERGESHYVSEGVLRASHRALGTAPYAYLGLPYHPSTADVVEPLGSDVAELVIDLHPTSNVFVAGRRVRVVITCCDADNAATPVLDPPPVLTVHRSARHPSLIRLPVMPPA